MRTVLNTGVEFCINPEKVVRNRLDFGQVDTSVREEVAMIRNEKLVKTIKTLDQLTIILCV